MKVGICGGGLQGVELCWLAGKAGWHTVLAERRVSAPACGLCNEFVQCDLRRLDEPSQAAAAARLLACDLLIPALEDSETLTALTAWCRKQQKPFAFDPDAYAVSSSKLRSRELFTACSTPIPTPWDGRGEFPLCAKPSAGSGSRGVCLLHDTSELQVFQRRVAIAEWIVEAYCPGPSLSLEICGVPGAYRTYQVTDLFMDEVFDCRAVSAPSQALPATIQAMERELRKLAEALRLRGLMDLEVIVAPDGLRVLEIDARVPSQTPTAVWLSTGINLAEELAACFIPYQPVWIPRNRHVRYEHVLCRNGHLSAHGEHIMAQAGPLTRLAPFFGAEEALLGVANPADLQSGWVATLMFSAADASAVRQRRAACLHMLEGQKSLAGLLRRCREGGGA